MTIKEKALLDALLSNDEARRGQAFKILFERGKGEYSGSFMNCIMKCFSDYRYWKHKETIYDTVISLVYEDIRSAKPENLYEAKSLKAYILTMFHNCAMRNRKVIDDLLGFNRSQVLLNDRHDKEDETPAEGMADRAGELISMFISRIPNPSYREILTSNKSPEEIAQETGKPFSAIYNTLSKAKVALAKAALPEIRLLLKHTYTLHQDKLSEEKNELLSLFFSTGEVDDKDKLSRAILQLLKDIQRERDDFRESIKKVRQEEKRQEKEAANINNNWIILNK